MSLEKPETIDEWSAYIQTLEGEDLRSKARAANSWSFVQMLQREGMDPDDITLLMYLFAARMVRTNQMPPSDGYLDLRTLAASSEELGPYFDALT